ncbi:hypothetical protein GDO81_022972 [Engystomops pustulosus]|uniref:Uncharacterized protein n=1 Tax=Engystomops pustulosus TaxID=76066 RepID=A0AAV6YM36_ENGPU|nr:hypothetical protein GDO81_022972 [Engystomops pustulosus]
MKTPVIRNLQQSGICSEIVLAHCLQLFQQRTVSYFAQRCLCLIPGYGRYHHGLPHSLPRGIYYRHTGVASGRTSASASPSIFLAHTTCWRAARL